MPANPVVPPPAENAVAKPDGQVQAWALETGTAAANMPRVTATARRCLYINFMCRLTIQIVEGPHPGISPAHGADASWGTGLFGGTVKINRPGLMTCTQGTVRPERSIGPERSAGAEVRAIGDGGQVAGTERAMGTQRAVRAERSVCAERPGRTA